MSATTLRADLVILVGAFLGLALMLNALRQWATPASRCSLHSLDTLAVVARLLLGVSLLLLALFELAGRTLWANARIAPAWGAPAGVTILIVLLASALVAGTLGLLRRHHHQHRLHA